MSEQAAGNAGGGAPPQGAALLELRGVGKTYQAGGGFGGGFLLAARGAAPRPAVRDVSFTVRAGETFGLIGESGCGKSTLGYIIARVLRPDTGAILWHGADALSRPRGAPPGRHGVQIVFQDLGGALNPARKIRWILHEALRAKKVADAALRDQIIARMLPRVGLDGYYLERFQHELSGGQKQRVAILLALLMEPKLIVADEVVSSLDVSVRAQILNLMRELQDTMGLSYLFISHDIDVVYSMAHTIAVMYRGEIVEEGPAEAVYRGALHPYTRLLLGDSDAVSPASKAVVAASATGGPFADTADALFTDAHAAASPVFTNAADPAPTPVPGAAAAAALPPRQEACGFYERCPIARPGCRSARPVLRETGPGYIVRGPYAASAT
ncbi:MAG: ATP-binding cassette domain-containing protein [Clostridiales bacterium]|jgi:ABC-type glutathione transport system ATPase component|nr:ATP-binding cassette domain-containing protein [Clostridiales bacterium]